jgi:hypothetical protein
MKTGRFAGARGLFCAAATLALALPGFRAARAAEAPPMLVATPDPALLSALDAAFSPRGVRVAMADRALRATGDDLGPDGRRADLVWLCDMTPVLATVPAPAGGAAPAPAGGAAPATALCVRPHQGTVIVRRIAVTMPLSPEDAAALALSVQVALMPDAAAPAATVARPAPGTQPARAAGAKASGAHGLTLELAGGFGAGPGGHSSSLSLAAVHTPASLGHYLGVGAAVAIAEISPSGDAAVLSVRDRGPALLGSVEKPTDLMLRLFARAQAIDGPVWIQLDLGPAAHATNDVFDESWRWFWSLDTFAGIVVPFGRFFAGVRGGGEYAVIGHFSSSVATDGRWNLEALVTTGVGWF